MSDEHLGERAELYALGALDAREADAVNAHAARCADCARLVGAAERAVMTLDAATVPDVAPPPELERRIAAIGRVSPLRRQPVPRRLSFVKL
ncbi:MAG: zf-HC2 domain-containing protein, partial [Candidatus Eremiobacteraeota bacterium]|nr:zf-HC2 domain-containing protein [Candidatus Eremiobacteraeota bacterium]